MKIRDIEIEATGEIRDRNRRLIFDCPLSLSPDIRLISEREELAVASGKQLSVPGYSGRTYSFEHMLSAVQNMAVTLPAEYGGYTLTVGQLAIAIEMVSDQLAESYNEASEPLATPSIPQNITGSVTATSVSISWDSATGATHYGIYRGNIFVGDTVNTSYTENELQSNTVYGYQVRSLNANNDASDLTAEVNFTTAAE